MQLKKIEKKTCFVCHQSSKHISERTAVHPFIAGPSGIMDLDGRPRELTESILHSFLEVCPHCGYIAGDIEEKTSVTSDYLRSPEYSSPDNLKESQSPTLFLRAASIQLADNNREKAIEYYLFAAWCADSLLNHELAVTSRKYALSLIFADGRTFADLASKKWVPVLDIMRRCGDFKSVLTHCTSLLAIAGPVLQQDLEFELRSAQLGDREPHTNADAAAVGAYRSGTRKGIEEFVIAGKSYTVDEVCYGNGWNWIPETRTLVLTNYHGTAIRASGDITIRLEQTDNQIRSSHGPGIHISQGNLTISGLGIISIQGEQEGISVESGKLDIIRQSVLEIRTEGYGILTSGPILITEGSVIEIHSGATAIKSVSGGLNTSLGPVLRIFGVKGGIYLGGDVSISSGLYQIESPEGYGILIHRGSLSAFACGLEIICRKECIWIEKGNGFFGGMRSHLNGASGIRVSGSCILEKSMFTISGEDKAIAVSMDLRFTGMRCECSGKTVISAGGNLQVEQSDITGSGETGISIGGDLNITGGILILTGDLVMQVLGDFTISEGQVMCAGRIRGMVVNGSYSQSGGQVSASGEALDGLCISGKEMILSGGTLTASGRNCGLHVSGDVILDLFSLTASGNIAFSVDGMLKADKGDLKVAGEEIGLSLKGGNLVTGLTVSVNITGNTAIFSTRDIEITGGTLQITGQFGGIIMETGDLIINGGVSDISADEYGILLQSGSIRMSTGIITVKNSRMTDSGGCGIVIQKGNLEAAALMKITGESYGISVPEGNISLNIGKLNASGYRSGITGKSLILGIVASLTSYGKTEGAVVLTGKGPWQDKGVRIWAGTSEKTAIEDVYSGQRYIHAYTVNLPEPS